MTPFGRARLRMDQVAEIAEIVGKEYGPEFAAQVLQQSTNGEVWLNDTYQVTIYHDDSPWGPVVHLSIRRLDREVIRDWRELQEIKNQLVGRENEGVEIFPAESRLVDTANQYHLFVLDGRRLPWIGNTPLGAIRNLLVLADTDRHFPFGFQERLVSGEQPLPELPRIKQRPRDA